MKTVVSFFFILLCSCSNDFEILAPSRTVPVVYGLISLQDSIYRIRLTRSFVAEGDIEAVAKNSDSLYFKNAEVQLELRTPDGRLIEGRQMNLIQIEDRLDGLFSTSPNRIYQCSKFLAASLTLPAETEFGLNIRIPELGISTTARSKIPWEPELMSPIGLLTRSTLNLYDFRRNVVFIKHLSDVYTQFQLIFRYSEYRFDTWEPAEFVYKRSLMPGEPQLYPDDQPWRRIYQDSVFLDAGFLFPLVRNHISNDPEIAARKFKEIEIRVLNADPEFANYYSAGQYLTDYNNQNYTNITNGLGLFSNYRTRAFPTCGLNRQSLDSLCSGLFTRHLKFKDWE